MTLDIFGQSTTMSDRSGAAAASWNATQRAFLAHGASTPQHLAATLAAAPDFALAHAVKGLFLILLGRRELIPTAREALDSAETSAAAAPISPREMAFVDALRAWLQGNPSQSVSLIDGVLKANPTDTLAMKLGHAIRFVLGDATGMRRSIEAVMPTYDLNHPGRGYLLGCHAFALEETGDYARAEAAGRSALDLAPDDAWGLHAVAHVYDMTCDAPGGLAWLQGREAAWGHCNNFRFHVWWHKALMHLDLGQMDEVLALYDRSIRAEHTDDYRDISNATSLLMRLELEGVDIGQRWEELADLSSTRAEDGSLIFADLHYLLALIADGRDEAVTTLLGRIHADAKRGGTEIEMRMAHPGLAAAEGLEAFGDGRYGIAFRNLSRARRQMHLAGGSHAQRDVFERLTIDAGIRAGRLDEAELILDDRKSRRARRDDGYARARRSLISDARRSATCAGRIPAE